MVQSPNRLVAALAGLALALLAVASASADGLRHTVVAGDTLSGIAYLYGVTIEAIADANDIEDPNLIFPGQVLEIPGLGTRDEPAPPGGAGQYTVQEGDTLGNIALAHGVSVAELQLANGLEDADLIYPGQLLVLPAPPANDVPILDISWMPETAPSDPFVEHYIEQAAAAYGVPVGLAKALSWIESGWRQDAVSPAGARGLFQIMPETAAFMEAEVFGFELNEDVSVNDNACMGVRLLAILIDAYGGDTDRAIAAYYQGHGATSSGIMYEDTRHYVSAVTAIWQRYWP